MGAKSNAYKKPPSGIRPRWLIAEERLREINQAIVWYTNTNHSIPKEWLEERDSILNYFGKRAKKKTDMKRGI